MKVLIVYPNQVESPKDISQGLAQIVSMLKLPYKDKNNKQHAGQKIALLD